MAPMVEITIVFSGGSPGANEPLTESRSKARSPLKLQPTSTDQAKSSESNGRSRRAAIGSLWPSTPAWWIGPAQQEQTENHGLVLPQPKRMQIRLFIPLGFYTGQIIRCQ